MSSETPPCNLFYFSNQLPPDELNDAFRRLRIRSKTQRHPVLRDFLSQATLVLREEISQLPGSLRSQLPPLGNALDLAEVRDLNRGPLAGALEGVLLCLLHVASVIGYYERVPGQFQFSKSTTCFTGIGAGLFGAAAISSSPTLADLPQVGSEALRIAWRMGVLVNDISQSIESQGLGAEPESCAAVVMDLDENTVRKEVDDFNTSTCSPIPSQMYVSAGGTDNVTISGPPSQCRKIFRVSSTLRSARYARLAVYGGLCHAPHIYNSTHADSIMSASTPAVVDQMLLDAGSVFSTGDGAPFQGATVRDLFRQIVLELLTGTIRWNLAMDGALNFLGTLPEECNVYALRPCGVAMGMVSTAKNRVSGCQFKMCDLLQWVFEDDGTETPLRREDSKIAIIGMSCRFPDGANDLDSFWQLLEEGRDVHKNVPADRYDVQTHTDPTGKSKNTSLTPFGCFIDQPGLFDAGFFDMSPREAAQTDPMHRLALVTAYEALEKSGFVANRTQSTDRRRVGTFYGQSCDDYREANAGQAVDTYYIPGGSRAFAPGRINYFFKFSGPSFDCDTACSASLATIQIGCTSLLHGDTDMVVAGGLNILTNSEPFAGLSQGHFLSKTGGCKTFDCDADGYCRADGIGSVILKRLDDAQRDNDNILGVIGAAATNHSADAISITHPHAPTQEYLYRHIMREAGVRPQDVDFVEMHGTGTQAGDATEVESVTAVFTTPKRTHPLYIGSVKANVGHGEAAAGVTALIKVLLALQRNAIPKHVGIKTALNPKFPDLNRLNMRIPTEQVPWPRSTARKRYAIVNNFSAAGGNTTLLVEEAPLRPEPKTDPRTAFTVAISAKSTISLKANLQNLIAYLESNPSVDLAHLSYTTMARRMHHNHRIAVHGSSRQSIMQEFQEYLPALDTQRPIPKTAPTIAFIFSGQGSFYTGIGRQLYDSHPGFQKQILRLNEVCLSHGFPSFLEAITGSPDEPQSEARPIVTQLTIVCVGIALSWLWGSISIKPSVVVGASIGEFAALHAAGVLSTSDTIYLAGKRALLLESLCTANTHGMLAIRATLEQVRGALATENYEVACVNSARDITLAGPVEDIANAQLALEAHGYKCTRVFVPYAFHSAHVDPILGQYEQVAGGVTFKPPSVPLISPLLADCVFDDKTINASYMRQATRQPVNLFESLHSASDTGLVDKKTVWIEIGPHGSYSNFIRSATPDSTLTIASLKRDDDNWRTFARGMAQLYNRGLDLDWNAWHSPFETQYLRLLDLPSYHWNVKNHWIPYTGDWLLRKGNNSSPSPLQLSSTSSHTSLVHHLVEESIGQNGGEAVFQSNVLHPDFLEAMYGHKMNGCAVATSSIHADIAFTLAKYLYSRIKPHSNISATSINIKNMHCEQGLIARKDRSRPQWIQIHAIADLSIDSVQLSWHDVDEQGRRSEGSLVTAVAQYGNPENWLQEWYPMTHLVLSRINDLQRLADEGKATSLSRDMIYTLFNNLVDYADKYRGMHRVVLHGMEAMANVTLDRETPGTWTVAPHYIDSVAHLAGFIVNGGNALDPRRNFYVTPGWKTLRFARPLVPGGQFMTYVHMLPVHGQPGFYAGDVYILQDGQIVGLVGGIIFRSFPRILLSEFFSPPDTKKKDQNTVHTNTIAAGDASITPTSQISTSTSGSDDKPAQVTPTTNDSGSIFSTSNSTSEPSAGDIPLIQQAMELIAQETEIDLHELSDGTEFSSIGVDSLLSLVLVQRFNIVLNINLHSAVFLDSPTIGDFKTHLLNHC